MTIKSDSPYDIKLSSGREQKSYGIVVEPGSLSVSAVAQDDSVYIRNVGKKHGDFDEQRSWKGGRGYDKLSDNEEGFWDSLNAWTMTKGHLLSGILWKYAKGLRKATHNFSNSKSWKALMGTSLTISVSFTPDETGAYDKAQFWVRWVGSSQATNALTAKLHSDSGGDPGTVLQTVAKAVTDVDGDSVSRLLTFDWTGTETLTTGTTYHLTLTAASGTLAGHWEVAADASGTSSKISSDAVSYSTPSPTFSMLYRITDADVARTFKRFFLDGHLYVVDIKDDGTTASQLYINGDRGQATGGSTTTLIDTDFGCRSAAWSDNVLAGAKIRFKKNKKWYYATIASHTGGTYTFSSATAVAPASGNPYYIYSTEYFTELTGHGLAVVTGEPAVMGQVVYFPQGDTTAFRSMATDFTAANNHKFRADAGSTPYAVFFLSHYDMADGAILWRANNGTVSVSYAVTVAYGTNLTWSTIIRCGDTTYPITGLNKQPGVLHVFKENGRGQVQSRQYTELMSKASKNPDSANGEASLADEQFLYYSWLHTVIRVFASQNDDIGQDYRSAGLPDGREGDIACIDSYTFPIFAVDAGSSGTSSVLMFDDIGWHELLRASEAGKRIRFVCSQPNPTTRNRIWTDMGGELVFQDMPLKKASPLYDSGALYQHETVVESSIIDMGAASDLPKQIKSLTATIKNLGAQGREVYLDYQIDKDCHASTWVPATSFTQSPESTAKLNLSNIRRFDYRLRMVTNDATIPIDIEGIVPNGYARTPIKMMWSFRIGEGGIYEGSGSTPSSDTSKLFRWLMENARFPYTVYMESKYLELDGYYCIVHPARAFPYQPASFGEKQKSVLTLVLEEA